MESAARKGVGTLGRVAIPSRTRTSQISFFAHQPTTRFPTSRDSPQLLEQLGFAPTIGGLSLLAGFAPTIGDCPYLQGCTNNWGLSLLAPTIRDCPQLLENRGSALVLLRELMTLHLAGTFPQTGRTTL